MAQSAIALILTFASMGLGLPAYGMAKKPASLRSEDRASQFIVGPSGLANIVSIQPFRGTGSQCPSPSVDTFFRSKSTSYTVDILSPISGSISAVQYCSVHGQSDHYEVAIDLDNGARLSFALEPNSGFLCSKGRSGFDNGYYQQYIRVIEGQLVSPGDVIARLYRPKKTKALSLVRFALEGKDSVYCPNVFTDQAESHFYPFFPPKSCEGAPYPKSLCFKPGNGEVL